MASQLASKRAPGTETLMDVDYVLVYRFANTGKETAMRKFEKLVQALTRVGLSTEVRNGGKHSLLIFVKAASDEYLYGEVYRSRMKDWLNGVRTAAPDKEIHLALDSDPMCISERLRIVFQLITNPREEGGAGITPKEGEWQEVETVFALHDHQYNRGWIKKWATTYVLDIKDLDEIRDRFGEKVAFYFAFMQSFFMALAAIAAFGVSAWAIFGNFSPTYGLINSLLCVGFVEYWKFQQQELAIRWGVKDVSSIEIKRKDFVGEKVVRDRVTGQETHIFPAPKRMQRQLLQIPFVLAASLALGTVIATCFGIEIFISEVYNGPFKSWLVYLPTILTTTFQPVVIGVLTELAQQLNGFENYESEGEYEAAMTQKIFVLNFITSYLPIMLTAFVYVPFGRHIVPYLDVFSLTVRPFAENEKEYSAPTPEQFTINPDRLKKQMIYFAVTAQIVGQVLEVVLPYVKHEGFSWYKKYQSKRAARKSGQPQQDVAANDHQDEAAFLQRVRQEAELDIYDVTVDMREVVVQFGYLALFSIIWPVTSLSFLINDWLEMRTDAVKICIESQRPTPMRSDGIGPWLNSLEFLAWTGSITTAAIAYLFSNGGMGPDGTPKNLSGWTLMVTIFFSEHAYLFVRYVVRYAITQLDSPGRQKERQEKFLVRKRYLDEALGDQAARLGQPQDGLASLQHVNRRTLEEEARASSLQGAGAARIEKRFWLRQRSWEETVKVGNRLIDAAPAVPEGKKRR